MSATSMPKPIIKTLSNKDDFFLSDEKLDKNQKELLDFWKCVHNRPDLFFGLCEVGYIFYSARVVGDEDAPERVLSKQEVCERSKKLIHWFLSTEQVCNGKKGGWSNGFFGSRWFDKDYRKEGLTVRVAFYKRSQEARKEDEKRGGKGMSYALHFTWEELPYKRCGNPACKVYSNTMKKCSVCESERYCSEECQKAHWKEHKKVCKKPEEEDEDEE